MNFYEPDRQARRNKGIALARAVGKLLRDAGFSRRGSGRHGVRFFDVHEFGNGARDVPTVRVEVYGARSGTRLEALSLVVMADPRFRVLRSTSSSFHVTRRTA